MAIHIFPAAAAEDAAPSPEQTRWVELAASLRELIAQTHHRYSLHGANADEALTLVQAAQSCFWFAQNTANWDKLIDKQDRPWE